jgi:hypothetical protein
MFGRLVAGTNLRKVLLAGWLLLAGADCSERKTLLGDD